MKKLKYFFKLIGEDIGISWSDLLKISGVSVVIVAGLEVCLLLMAYLLSWLVDELFGFQALNAALGVYVVIFLLVFLVNYLVSKWREAEHAIHSRD